MAVLSIASAKGGCGKTTLSIILSTALAKKGYKVSLLDCDLNQHASQFGVKNNLKNLVVVPSVDENNILSEIRQSENNTDITIIDLPGGSSTLSLKSLQRSNFVLVPCQASLPDVRDAFKTLAQIDDAEDLARCPIPRSLIWSRVLPGFESRAAKHVRQSVEGKNVNVFSSAMLERAAFREMHITGISPIELGTDAAPSLNVEAISNELLENLLKISETSR